MNDRLDLLINVLMDFSAREDERDDAAMYLAEYCEVRSINALISIGKDSSDNETVLNSCGESLGAIWVKQNFFDEKAYHALSGTARYGVYVVIKSRKPNWLAQYQLEKDNFLD